MRGNSLRFFFLGLVVCILATNLLGNARDTKDNGFIYTGLAQASQSSNHDDLEMQYSHMLVFYKLGRYDQVVLGCKEIISREFEFIKAYELLLQASAKQVDHSASPQAFEQVILYFRNFLDDNPQNSYAHFGLGLTNKYARQYTEAISHLQKSIEYGANFWEVYEELIPYLKHQEELESLISLLREYSLADPENPYLYQGLAYLHFWLDDYGPSLRNYNRSLSIQKQKGDQRAVANCLFYLAYLYMYLNDYENASENIQRSIELSKSMGDKFQLAKSLELLSFIHFERSNYGKAYELCNQAYSIARDLSNEKMEALCLRTLGVLHTEMGNLSKAREFLERSSDFLRDVEETQKYNVSLYWRTVLYNEMGDYSMALATARQGLRISQQLGFKTAQAFLLSEIGDIYYSLGNYDKALDFNKRALSISEKYIGKWSREKCLNTIGYVYLERDKYSEALDYFSQALDYIRRINHNREEAECLYNIGLAHFYNDDIGEAKKLFLASLERADLSGERAIEGKNCNRLGQLYCKIDACQESVRYYSKALSIGEEIGHPNIIWEAYAGLGEVSTRQKKFNQAVGYFEKSIEVIEGLRSQFIVSAYRSGFFQSKIRIYEQLVDLLYDMHVINPSGGYDRECFFYAEKAKARAFLDDLQQAGEDFSLLFKEKEDDIETLSKRISHLLTKLNNAALTGAEHEQLWRELERTEEELQNFIEREKREHSDYAKTVGLEPLDLDMIQDRLLDDKTGLIAYLVGEQNIFIFFCTHDDISVHRVPPDVSQSTLDIVRNYIRILSSRKFTGKDCETAGNNLCERLIKTKTNGFGSQITKLIIIPDRELHYLPFETLVCRVEDSPKVGRAYYLMEQYKISYAPSASTLFSIIHNDREHVHSRDLLAVGDPVYEKGSAFTGEPFKSDDIVHEYYLDKKFSIFPLKYASKEIKSICRLFKKDSTLLVSQEGASEETVKSLHLDEFRIIHFATHSLLDENNANRSALVLNLDDDPSEDGFFQAREIYAVKLNADLVVLSACQTAKGKIEKGEGIQGLARAFFYAGTKSVLASLWKIDDRSTAEFMKKFYEYLAEGKTKQDALCLTKIKMLDTEYNQPYYWASFVLIGESDCPIVLQKSSWWDRLFN
ncbi:CHAT domain-containing protein [Acidobacteriota bacterium]